MPDHPSPSPVSPQALAEARRIAAEVIATVSDEKLTDDEWIARFTLPIASAIAAQAAAKDAEIAALVEQSAHLVKRMQTAEAENARLKAALAGAWEEAAREAEDHAVLVKRSYAKATPAMQEMGKIRSETLLQFAAALRAHVPAHGEPEQ